MHYYDINIYKTRGRNEVHRRSHNCGHKPEPCHLEPIGLAFSIEEAVGREKRKLDGWHDADSCSFCLGYEQREE